MDTAYRSHDGEMTMCIRSLCFCKGVRDSVRDASNSVTSCMRCATVVCEAALCGPSRELTYLAA